MDFEIDQVLFRAFSFDFAYKFPPLTLSGLRYEFAHPSLPPAFSLIVFARALVAFGCPPRTPPGLMRFFARDFVACWLYVDLDSS